MRTMGPTGATGMTGAEGAKNLERTYKEITRGVWANRVQEKKKLRQGDRKERCDGESMKRDHQRMKRRRATHKGALGRPLQIRPSPKGASRAFLECGKHE